MPRYIDADLCKMLGATCIAIRLTSTGELFPILSLDAIPTADVRENVRGEWIYGEKRKFIDLANADRQYKELGYPHRPYINMKCSCCRMITIADESIRYEFCPHCGADMRGEK